LPPGFDTQQQGNKMSSIEWTDRTVNPIKRADGGNYCEKVSPGCANCYASGLNAKGSRFGGNGKHFGGVRPEARPEMGLNIDMLQKWGRMRSPKKIFVGSMTDIFGQWVPDWMGFALFDAMLAARSQTFQILTKRPERAVTVIADWLRMAGRHQLPENIWLGISSETQATLDERLPSIIRARAQVIFLSIEPILGPITLFAPDMIDWVIIGGESGPGARPLDLEWVHGILRQCQDANIPAFVKQLGSRWDGTAHGKGGDPDEWSENLRVRMFPGDTW
jgi:protein gp37